MASLRRKPANPDDEDDKRWTSRWLTLYARELAKKQRGLALKQREQTHRPGHRIWPYFLHRITCVEPTTTDAVLMDPEIRRQRGRDAAERGDYETALREYIWYHDHALDDDPACYGVRLSFALVDWMELAADYPPAERALRDIRDRKTQVLRTGQGSRALFHDVASINDYLMQGNETHALFRALVSSQPEFAATCAEIALPALVGARDYVLARQYLTDPAAYILRWSRSLDDTIQNVPTPEGLNSDDLLDSYVNIYLTQVRWVLAVLAGVGDQASVDVMKARAVAAVSHTGARRRVQIALFSAPAA